MEDFLNFIFQTFFEFFTFAIIFLNVHIFISACSLFKNNIMFLFHGCSVFSHHSENINFGFHWISFSHVPYTLYFLWVCFSVYYFDFYLSQKTLFSNVWGSLAFCFFVFFFWFVFWFLIGADNNDWKLCILVGPINDWFYLRWLERTVSMGKFQVFQYPYVIALGLLTFPRKNLFQFSVWRVPEHV